MDTDFCYFCMQLPPLSIGEAPAISLEEFDDRLRSVPPKAASYVRSCSFPMIPEAVFPRGSAAAKFRSFEEGLRYEIARFRAAKSGRSLPPRPRGARTEEEIPSRIQSIAGLNPLEREKKLNEMRSAFLEQIEKDDPLSREAAVCYRLRLSMLWRETTFGDMAGREVFRNTVDTIEQESIGEVGPSSGEKNNRENPTKAEV